jgi:FkbM family methyltransferase
MRKLALSIKRLFKKLGFGVIRNSTLALYEQNARAGEDIDFLLSLSDELVVPTLSVLRSSKSQLRQDLFVLGQLGFKKNGYFVEFGATNGFELSNSYLLEKKFGWTGILAEPARGWHEELRQNRSASIETMCVWKETGVELSFIEVDDKELSTIQEFAETDVHKDMREHSKMYKVQTISLSDLLKKHNAPKEIDYLSIDTEGSEFDILNAFEFDNYSFRVITCEHNYSPSRQKVFELLTKNGYRRCCEELSQFDDWYVKA